MTAIPSLDVRAPDQRRKQLLAKLMQQQIAQHPAGHAPGAGGAAIGGRPTFALGGAFGRQRVLPVTQGNNVLAQALARLGVGGRSLANEVSQGAGVPVNVPRPYSGGPSTQEVSNYNVGDAPVPSGGVGGATGGGGGTPTGFAAAPPTYPSDGSYTYTNAPADSTGLGYTGADAGPAQLGLMDTTSNNLVPLGGGMYYDPATDTVHGGNSF